MRFRFEKRFNGDAGIYIGTTEICYISLWFNKLYVSSAFLVMKGCIPLDSARRMVYPESSVKILQVITSVVLI